MIDDPSAHASAGALSLPQINLNYLVILLELKCLQTLKSTDASCSHAQWTQEVEKINLEERK